MIKSKWLWSISIVIILIISLLLSLYVKTMQPVKEQSKEAIIRAKEILHLSKVIDVEHYFGKDAYYVIDAQSEIGNVFIIVPEEKTKKITYVKKEEGITKEQAIKIIEKTKNPKQILDIRIAIDQNIPLWEIVYEENAHQRTFIYLTFKTGEFYKRFTISK
jgi:uncharacterized protein YpmB